MALLSDTRVMVMIAARRQTHTMAERRAFVEGFLETAGDIAALPEVGQPTPRPFDQDRD